MPDRLHELGRQEARIEDSECVKCMHCINVMPKALKPGKERGATILVGSKAPIIGGALLSSVLVPFLEMKEPYEDLKELTEAIWEFWSEHGKNRERVGEFIQRVGLGNFLEEIGLEPVPEMIAHPRTQSVHLLRGRARRRRRVARARRIHSMSAAERITDIGPPHYEKFLPPVDQEELRQVGVPRDPASRA